MLFNTVFTSAIALAMGAFAAPLSGEAHDGQIRIFGERGCSDVNLGAIVITDDTVNTCQTFGNTGGHIVNSVKFKQKTVNNCTLSIFNDETCDQPSYPVEIDNCSPDGPSFASFLLSCPFAE